MKKSILILFAAVALSACSDDETVSVARTADDYQPNTPGSTWSYSSELFDFTQTITRNAKKISGKTYFEVKVTIPDLGSFKAYMRKDGINYIHREIYTDQYDDGEYIYLKDAPEGTTWTEMTYNTEIDDVPVATTETLKILETGGTYEVNGVTFNDVIMVEVASLTEGSEGDPYIIFNYYAKGVGLILVEDNTGEFVSTHLVDYTIKP